MVSQQLIKELQTILKEEYGKDLQTEEITQIANNLVGYFDLLAKINHRENAQNTSQGFGKITVEKKQKIT